MAAALPTRRQTPTRSAATEARLFVTNFSFPARSAPAGRPSYPSPPSMGATPPRSIEPWETIAAIQSRKSGPGDGTDTLFWRQH
ncbi:hypothetical protein TgHK011_004600 [Trichoderma gracile]|nr:hypothetical protein TgHK011_004600 [Trichoderma gracile]